MSLWVYVKLEELIKQSDKESKISFDIRIRSSRAKSGLVPGQTFHYLKVKT